MLNFIKEFAHKCFSEKQYVGRCDKRFSRTELHMRPQDNHISHINVTFLLENICISLCYLKAHTRPNNEISVNK